MDDAVSAIPKYERNQSPEERKVVEEFYVKEISRRNAETVNMALERFNKLLQEGLTVIATQQNTLQMHEQKIADLQNALNIHKAGLTGRGPSVRT